MNKYLKWSLLLIGLLIAILPLILISPLLLPITAVAYWYFTKKKPNERLGKIAKNGIIVSALGSALFVYSVATADDPEVASVADTEEVVADAADSEEATDSEVEEESEDEREEREAEDARRRAEWKEKQEEKDAKDEEERQEKEREKELAEANPNKSGETEAPSEPAKVAEGQEDAKVNDNIPHFNSDDITSTEVYHRNGPLDSLGRVTAANAVVGVEIMPAEERGSIGHHEPTGWNQASYANIGSGGWLYNRSHLIGHQLTGNDDYANLMTGTRWFNMRMLEYENFVANYVETTENHVRYRVTPVFEGNNLVASGAYMEGFSIEDNGEGLMFNIYIPNSQPDVEINYADGSSIGPAGPSQEGEIKKYKPAPAPKQEAKPAPAPAPKPEPKPEPKPAPAPAPAPAGGDLSSVDANGNGKVTIQEAKDAGFQMPIYSDHWLYQYMDDRDGDGMVGE